MIKRLLRCTRATAAVEAAIFAPIFLLFTLGITDLGSAMYVRTTVNAAIQAGAAYAVMNSVTGSPCSTPPIAGACLSGIKAAMNDATGNASFCTPSGVCTALIGGCADGSALCIIISTNYSFTPILSDAVYAWAKLTTVSYTTTVRIR